METFLEEFKEQIITGVRSPGVIVQAWISQQLCTHMETTTITDALTPQSQMRELFQVVEEGTSQTKASFYQILSQEEPELMADLGKTNLLKPYMACFKDPYIVV